MEATDLNDPAYWESQTPDFRCNPVGSEKQQGLIESARTDPRLAGHVLVATSGSTGEPKWIALSKPALLTSARAVNAHLGATAEDRWLCALPAHHVGGLGVFARAYAIGQPAVVFSGRWRDRAAEFVALCGEAGITLTSVTPTQVYDLVAERLGAPDSLRAVIVGGGRLEPDLARAARDLGWPVLASYGMTEACSQIATGPGDDGWLPVLPHWEVVAGESGRLRLRGPSLFSGTVDATGRFEAAQLDGDGWFETRDRVELRAGELRFLGRIDDWVKKLGELVSLDDARRRLDALARAAGRSATVIAVPDARLEHRLVAVFEGTVDPDLVALFNAGAEPYARLDEARAVPAFPRTELGKIAWSRLT